MMSTPFGIANRSTLHRLVNRLARLGRISTSLEENDLLETAQRITGLEYWGEDDFRRPLHILVESLARDAKPTPVGRMLTRRDILQRLSTRLRIEDHIRRNPEVLLVRLPDPVIITGLPRTGTTFLHRLLAQDPENRVLQLWEMTNPVPPPQPETYSSDRRRRRHRLVYAAGIKALFSRNGQRAFQAIHETGPDDPEECLTLLATSFRSLAFYLHDEVTGYLEWLQREDPLPAYAGLKRQLQVLLSRMPAPRLILKSPVHLGALDALFRTFPDARIVWTHRDPLQAIPSACSHAAFFRSFRSDDFDPSRVGSFRLDLARREIESACAVRDQGREERFLDVSFPELIHRPLDMVVRIYAFLSITPDRRAWQRMESWINRQQVTRARGTHHYQPETFGLTPSAIRSTLARYGKRFSTLVATP